MVSYQLVRNISFLSLAVALLLSACSQESAGADLEAKISEVASSGTAVGNLVNLNANESTGEGLSYAWQLTEKPGGSAATLENASGKQTSFTPDVVGDYVVELTVTDSSGQTDRASERVTVQTVEPRVLTAEDDTATTEQETLVTINVLANDRSGDASVPPTIIDITPPDQGGSVTVNTDNTVTYTPDTGFTGVETFQYTISDNPDAEDPDQRKKTATVTVTVTPISEASSGVKRRD